MLEPNALTGATIDRAADRRRRDAGWLAAQRADRRARAVVLGDEWIADSGAGRRSIGDRLADG
jgi:hypothetical protein